MKPIIVLLMSAALGGCASVQAQYATAPGFDDATTSAANAAKGLSYYSLQKIHVGVAPQAPAAGADKPADPATVTPPDGAKNGPVVDAQPPTDDPKASKLAAAHGKKPGGAQSKPDPAAPVPAGTSPPGGAPPATGAPVAGNTPQPPGADAVHPTAIINGKTWVATLSVKSDDGHGFMMGGTNGFWKKTTITASRQANSNIVDTVTVKAENLTATRLGQVATILGYFINPAAGAGKDLAPKAVDDPDALKSFDFDVSTAIANTDQPISGTHWSWNLQFAPNPDGAVSFTKFLDGATAAKGVNYFPVPACLTAKLVLSLNKVATATFPLVVSTAEIVRLEPLPLDGKLTLSNICSATVTGATTVDPYDEVFSDLAGVQSAYKQLIKPPAAGGAANAPTSATDTSAPAKPPAAK